jgi:hypothetical protein
VDCVDNLPSCYEHLTNSKIVDKSCHSMPYPLFHKAYYYDGYLFIYLQCNNKKKREDQEMKISCPKNELVNALSIVSKAVATKPQTPILSCIYLRAETGYWKSRQPIMKLA